MGKDLQIVEVRGADLPPPWGDVVVADEKDAQLPLAGLHPGIEFAAGDPEGGRHLLGHVLIVEVVPPALAPLLQAARFQTFRGAAGDGAAGLPQDFQRFPHLLDPHPVAGKAVPLLGGGHLPIKVVVALVTVHLAQIPADPRGPQHGAGEAPVDGLLPADGSQAGDAATEDGVIGNQPLVLVDFWTKPVTEVGAFLQPAIGQIHRHPANAEVVVVDQPLPGGRFPQVVDHLPLPENVEEGGLGPHVGQERPQPEQVVGNAVQLQHQHPDEAGPPGHGDVGQALGGVDSHRLVEHAGRIVPTAHVGDKHHVGAALGNFFHAPVEVADDGFAVHHVLPVQGHHQPEHPVHGRMVGSKVDHHGLRVGLQLRHGH